jgi:hypothetical protein
VKILDYSCSQDKDLQKPFRLNKCVDELKKFLLKDGQLWLCADQAKQI